MGYAMLNYGDDFDPFEEVVTDPEPDGYDYYELSDDDFLLAQNFEENPEIYTMTAGNNNSAGAGILLPLVIAIGAFLILKSER